MANTLKDVLNRANPNTLADAARAGKLGSMLGLLAAFKKGAVSSNIMTLAEGQKALVGLIAYVTAGSVTGVMTFVPGTPATTQFTVNKDGNIQFFATDAVTAAEVSYIPMEGDIIEEDALVVSNTFTPAGGRTARLILSATATAGASTGAKTTAARAAAPSAGQVAVTAAGLIAFNGTDAVTRATVRFIAAPKVSVTDSLVATSDLT
jgi:hypothetical protein